MMFLKSFRGNGSKYRFLFIFNFLLTLFQVTESYSQITKKDVNLENQILTSEKRYLFEEFYSDSLTSTTFYIVLSINPEPKFNSTLIKYSYYKSIDSVHSNKEYWWEETLADETKKWYALHPPRALLNEVHQLLPFPEIPKNKSLKYEWKERLSSFEGWDNIPRNTIIKSRYKIVSDTLLEYNGAKINCRKIKARSNSALGSGSSIFYFNQERGFVLIENKINSIYTRLSLIKEL